MKLIYNYESYHELLSTYIDKVHKWGHGLTNHPDGSHTPRRPSGPRIHSLLWSARTDAFVSQSIQQRKDPR